MRLYHGTANDNPVIPKGAYVTPQFSRAVKYARYPDNGEGNEMGYVFELHAPERYVKWEKRPDCRQGTLKRNVPAKKFTVCDVKIDTIARESPTKLKQDGSSRWANGEQIIWSLTK